MTSEVRFAILVYEDVEPIDIGATYGVLSIAKRSLPQITMFLVAATAGPVRLANGLVVEAHYGYADCPPADVVVVTGGPGWTRQCENSATLDFIRRMAATSTMASVCTGGAILAASGLLDGRRATTRRSGVPCEKTPLQIMAARHPKVQAVEALLVDCGPVVTGGGVTLGIDTMLHLLERFFGRAAAEEVARLMEYTNAWEANSQALRTYADRHGPN